MRGYILFTAILIYILCIRADSTTTEAFDETDGTTTEDTVEDGATEMRTEAAEGGGEEPSTLTPPHSHTMVDAYIEEQEEMWREDNLRAMLLVPQALVMLLFWFTHLGCDACHSMKYYMDPLSVTLTTVILLRFGLLARCSAQFLCQSGYAYEAKYSLNGYVEQFFTQLSVLYGVVALPRIFHQNVHKYNLLQSGTAYLYIFLFCLIFCLLFPVFSLAVDQSDVEFIALSAVFHALIVGRTAMLVLYIFIAAFRKLLHKSFVTLWLILPAVFAGYATYHSVLSVLYLGVSELSLISYPDDPIYLLLPVLLLLPTTFLVPAYLRSFLLGFGPASTIRQPHVQYPHYALSTDNNTTTCNCKCDIILEKMEEAEKGRREKEGKERKAQRGLPPSLTPDDVGWSDLGGKTQGKTSLSLSTTASETFQAPPAPPRTATPLPEKTFQHVANRPVSPDEPSNPPSYATNPRTAEAPPLERPPPDMIERALTHQLEQMVDVETRECAPGQIQSPPNVPFVARHSIGSRVRVRGKVQPSKNMYHQFLFNPHGDNN